MTQQATINDHITFRPGARAPRLIALGPVEIDLTADGSATLSWIADNGAAGMTAIAQTQYEEYVRQKRIKLTK